MADTAFGDVPGYDSFERLAAGGFSIVYRARQTSLDRVVAVKVLNLVEVDERAMARFRRECTSMGRLSGREYVVPIFDAGMTTSGFPFLSMEFITGGTLGGLIARQGALGVDDVVRYGREIALALAAAHSEGILHRDIKPENVLLDRLGRSRLADFGVAALEASSGSTTPTFAGTVGFIAPEVLEGHGPTIASDIYGLGSTLFALATGQAPYGGSNGQAPLATVARVLRDGVAKLPLTGVPPEMAVIIRTAMAHEPRERYLSANAVAAALARLQREHHPTTVHAVIPPPAAPVQPPTARTSLPSAPVDPNATALVVPADVTQVMPHTRPIIQGEGALARAVEHQPDSNTSRPRARAKDQAKSRSKASLKPDKLAKASAAAGKRAGGAGRTEPSGQPEMRQPAPENSQRKRRWPWLVVACLVAAAGFVGGAFAVYPEWFSR